MVFVVIGHGHGRIERFFCLATRGTFRVYVFGIIVTLHSPPGDYLKQPTNAHTLPEQLGREMLLCFCFVGRSPGPRGAAELNEVSRHRSKASSGGSYQRRRGPFPYPR